MINYKTILLVMLATVFPIEYIKAESAINAASVVKIIVNEGGGVRSLGSGVHLGNGIVLTCAHLGGTQAQIIFPNNNIYVGVLTSADREWDQAVYDIGEGNTEEHSPLAKDNPVLGQQLEAGGYPGGGSQAWRLGRLVRFTSANANTYSDFIVFTNAVTEGTSGGPVFNANGEVVGVVWGSRQEENVSYAQCTSRTRRFLLPHNARLEATRQMIQGGYSYQSASGCQSGSCGSSNYNYQQMTAPGSRQVISSGRSASPMPQPNSNTTQPKQPDPDLAAMQKDIEELKALTKTHTDAIKSNTEGLVASNDKLEAIRAIAEGTTSNIDVLKQQLAQLQTQTNQLQSLTETNSKTIIELKETSTISYDPSALAALEEKIKELQNQLANQKPTEPKPTEPKPTDDKPKIEYRGWMYFTSKGVPGCEEIDKKIAELRSKGAPIAVTYLTPLEAEVSGVPRIFVMHENQQVKGISNCKQYLASLVPY